MGYQAELTLRLAFIHLQRKQAAQALDAMSRAAAFARAAGGNRILAGVALEQARVLRAANRLADAETALSDGIAASRQMGERILLPRLLSQLAEVQLSQGRREQAADALHEADDLLEGLLTADVDRTKTSDLGS